MDEIKSQSAFSGKKKEADWFHAKIYVAGEVLSGDQDFIERLSLSSYEELETVWLRDVIQLKAYLIWQERGAQRERSADFRRGDYLDACEFYRRRLADQDIKREPEKFTTIRDYLKSRYFDVQGEKINETKAKELVETKARQYWITRSGKNVCNDERNWYEAENYVRAFYNHVIPAVMESDADSVECIRKAISWSEGEDSRLSIMNALEAAICIYFVKDIEYSSIRWRY